jgi:7,8-dihydro-6-hydroxymethylpterin-pyrophosphokinase
LHLLAFGQSVILDSRLTLPSPRLFEDSLILRCAAEAWGSYEHPIMQKTLEDLAQFAVTNLNVEFYSKSEEL